MTPRRLAQPGVAEPLNAAVHGVLLGAAAICLTYNAVAVIYRRQSHLARNTLIYGSLVALEVSHVRHHLARTPLGNGSSA